jgi:hypothetical protein
LADEDIEEVDYVAERGPGIPELPPGEPIEEQLVVGEEIQAYPGWEQETVEQFLKGAGAGMHLMIGEGEKDWYMTETDLDRIAPPLTRILNRYEPTLRASEYADPLLVAHGLGLYGWRSVIQQRQAARRKQEARLEQDGYVHADAEIGEEDIEQEPVDVEPDVSQDNYIPYAQRRREQ